MGVSPSGCLHFLLINSLYSENVYVKLYSDSHIYELFELKIVPWLVVLFTFYGVGLGLTAYCYVG